MDRVLLDNREVSIQSLLAELEDEINRLQTLIKETESSVAEMRRERLASR